jgi:tRNA modification GTPase
MRRLPGDTIAAISTALGPAAIAIVRLSGENALSIGDTVFRGSRRLHDCTSHTVHHGHVVDARGRIVDEVLATVLRSPNTYTTEHMVELSCHGGSLPARQVLSACLEAGARLAGPGEFTERAFMNGRMDLIQAEAVADLISARTPKGLEQALGQLEGGLSSSVSELREALADMRATAEAAIDFPEDTDADAARKDLARASTEAGDRVGELLLDCDLGIAVREGITVAIVGRPNVGKSSLMNALLARDRSIVTELPGTTRDAIEEWVNIDGVPFRLVDTAGWRDSGDVAELAGVARARDAASGSDLCLLVVDASAVPADDDSEIARALETRRTLVVGNKTDLGTAVGVEELSRLAREGDTFASAVLVSALSGAGVSRLREAIADVCLATGSGDSARVSNVRHVRALREVACCLQRVNREASRAPFEILAAELSAATHALGDISGETTPEEIIARIFERFCVGK